jgi:SOS-response transcriptional repressor LexA
VNEAATRKAQGRRLKAAREAAGYRSARDAALSNEWPESSYRAHESGMRTIGQDDAERYARRFRSAGAPVTAQSILFDRQTLSRDGVPSPFEQSLARHADVASVPLLSWVSAGKLADAHSQIPVEDVPLLAFADLGRGDFFALRVSGDSMDRVSPDGSVIVVNRAERNLVAGRAYVFAVRGETTYKLWHADPVYLAPYSTNPSNQPIFLKKRRDLYVIGRVRRTVLDL